MFSVEDAEEAKVTAFQGHNGLLDGRKVDVVNAESADIFFVVAQNNVTSDGERFCYLIEKTAAGGRIEISKPKDTQGLKGIKRKI